MVCRYASISALSIAEKKNFVLNRFHRKVKVSVSFDARKETPDETL